jgi:hypothetical protein
MDAPQLDEAFWPGRAVELQHTLVSQVVIEQAKGVLAERLGLDITGAFGVLRGAARSEGMKTHDLARTVVNNKDTLQAIVRFLARNPDFFHVSSRDERAVAEELRASRETPLAITEILPTEADPVSSSDGEPAEDLRCPRCGTLVSY